MNSFEKPLRLVIVDDSPEALDLLENLLCDIKYVEITGRALNASEAKKLILRSNPDLILLDIQMPEKSGFDLIKELKELSIDINVIFITAHNEYAIKAIKAAAFDYLLKPVDQSELLESIQRFKQNIKKELPSKIDLLISKLENNKIGRAHV